MANISKYIIIFLMLTVFLPSVNAQETPFKTYADAHKTKKYCFYASTLRMINISHNPDYYKLVNGIEKLLVYTLDSAAIASKSYKSIITSYNKIGFDEYASIAGGTTDFFIYGKDNKAESQFVGVFKGSDAVYAFYLRGRIEWQNIPALMQSFETGDMINIFQLNKKEIGKRPQNK